MAHLSKNSYGKQRVRLTKVIRGNGREGGTPKHELHEYTVQIMLHGEFEEIYTRGDNANCGPTDTMKNTVYAIARLCTFNSPEEFGAALTARFIEHFPQVHQAETLIEMNRWERIQLQSGAHPYAFVKQHGVRTAEVVRSRVGVELSVRGGLRGVEVFKSSGSAFRDFFRDEYTTLEDTDERILATTVDAAWSYALGSPSRATAGSLSSEQLGTQIEFNKAWSTIYDTVLEVFAEHESPSLQATLYHMGTTALDRVPDVQEISFSMPNQHHILFDLSAFDLENPNEIYYGTDSPFGIITGSVARETVLPTTPVGSVQPPEMAE